MYPEVIDGIDDISKELHKFAALLRAYKVNKQLVRTPIANNAKAQMAQVTMSVMEEFFAAVRHGNLAVLGGHPRHQLNQRTARPGNYDCTTLCKAVGCRVSMATFSNTDGTLTSCVRCSYRRSIVATRVHKESSTLWCHKRTQTYTWWWQTCKPVHGVVTKWRLDADQLAEITDKYFDDKDSRVAG